MRPGNLKHMGKMAKKEYSGEVRSLTFCVGASTSDETTLKNLTLGYAHFQNCYIMLRDELYRKVYPEKVLERFEKSEAYREKMCTEEKKEFKPKSRPVLDFSKTSKVRFAPFLKAVSRPGVIRSLFQERQPESAAKRKATRMANIEARNPEKYAEELAKKAKKAESGKLPDSAIADQLLAELTEFEPLLNLLAAGRGLKSHVIFNVVKRLDSSYKTAFNNFKNTGKFFPPKTKPLDEVESFFVPLCSISVSGVSGDGLFVNLSDRGLQLYLPVAATQQLVGSDFTGVAVGVRCGRLCITVPYVKPSPALFDKTRKAKYAGLDLGIRYLASIFVDDEKTPSVCLPGGDAIAINSRFNEKVAVLNSAYTDRCKRQKKLRRAKAEELGVKYVTEADMILMDAAYAAEALVKADEKAKLDKLHFSRKEYFANLMHKSARRILDHLSDAGVTKLFCARNLGEIKQVGSKMRKKERRKFHQIPILKLLDYLKLNADEYGIEVDDSLDEAYSSKISALLGENVLTAQKQRNKKEATKEPKKGQKNNSIDTSASSEPQSHSGTIPHGGSRNGRRFIEEATPGRKSRRSWHADINGAANHIVIGMQGPIKWNKKKIAKLSSPIIVDMRTMGWRKHGLVPQGQRPSLEGITPRVSRTRLKAFEGK